MRLAVGFVCLSLLAATASLAGGAHAETERSTVLLIDPGSAPLTYRLSEEIESLGLEVTVVPPGDPEAPLEARARAADAVGAIRITGSGSGSVDMTILDRATGKTVSRHLTIATPSDPASAELVATRTVELLRASLMELEAPHPPRGDAKVADDVRALAEPTAEPGGIRLAVATGLAAVVSPRLGVSLDVWVGLAVRAENGLGATARVFAPATRNEVTGAEGRIRADAWQYRLGATLDAPAFFPPLSARVEAGAALVTLATDGAARSPFYGVEERSLMGGPWLSLGLRLELARRLAVLAAGDATLLFPETIIRAAGREVTTFGRPLVSTGGGLELTW